MVRAIAGLALSALLFLFAGLANGQEALAPRAGAQEKARQLVDGHVANKDLMGIAAGSSVQGKTAWAYAAGFADEDAARAFEVGTLTRIASVAKPMTAIAVMQLVEQGKVDLDAPIQTYLPEFPVKAEGTITVRQLLQHTSGTGAYLTTKERENTTYYPTLSDALGIFQDRKSIAAPGTAFNYTTYGYVVLGAMIEAVSGMTYPQYMQANIWGPAGMLNTGIEVLAKRSPRNATLYHANGKGKLTRSTPTDLSDRIPGGGLASDLADMLRFGEAVLNGTLIKPATLELMLKDPGVKAEGNGYGLGWYLYGADPVHGPTYGHNGAQTGCSAFLMLRPQDSTVVVVLSNTSGAMPAVTDITIKLFDIAAEVAAEGTAK